MSSSSGFGDSFKDWVNAYPINEQPNFQHLMDPDEMLECLANEALAAETENKSGINEQPDIDVAHTENLCRDEDGILSTKPGDPNRRDLPVVVLNDGPLREVVVCQPGKINLDIAMATANPITVREEPDNPIVPTKVRKGKLNPTRKTGGPKKRKEGGPDRDRTTEKKISLVEKNDQWFGDTVIRFLDKVEIKTDQTYLTTCLACINTQKKGHTTGKGHTRRQGCFAHEFGALKDTGERAKRRKC